jgi:alkylation response protein AidB-like acyl-CoA dehydrogenase
VTERLILDEEPEILKLAARHAHHIQLRIGYEQGPQVPDPRAPEYAYALEAHERWWELVWDSMAERGFTEVTMTPEFGPDGYLQAAPFTRVPVAGLWDVNRWIGHRLKHRFRQKYNTQ